MDTLVSTARLLEITGYKTFGDMQRFLADQGIHLFRGRAGTVWTTVELINQAGGLRRAGEAEPLYGAGLL